LGKFLEDADQNQDSPRVNNFFQSDVPSRRRGSGGRHRKRKQEGVAGSEMSRVSSGRRRGRGYVDAARVFLVLFWSTGGRLD